MNKMHFEDFFVGDRLFGPDRKRPGGQYNKLSTKRRQALGRALLLARMVPFSSHLNRETDLSSV